MKRAGKLVVGAIAAISLLAGGTFAAFAVVDNADAIGIKVTPGSLTEAETGERITLNWGTNAIANVENLGLGATKKVGTLSLRAEYSAAKLPNNDPYVSYTGLLDVEVQDITVRGAGHENDPKFIDYLTVNVVENDIAENAFAGATKLVPNKVGNISHYTATGLPDDDGKTYSVFVTLSEDASPVYNTIKTDQVYLSFNWNKADADSNEDTTTKTYYLYDEENVFGGTAYAYAWAGATINHEYPGVQMTKVADKYYSVDIANTLTKVIFSNGTDKQTVDLTLNAAEPYWTLGDVNDKGKYAADDSAVAPTVLAHNYYVVGSWNEWNYQEAYAMSEENPGVGNRAIFNYTGDPFVTNGTPVELKVRGKDGTWYGAEGGVNFVFKTTEEKCYGYTVYLNNAGVVYVVADYTAD